jgi:pimeloyl-ACP methyl ester carboxylesterase
VPDDALGLVIFAHGSGSSRHSTRNRQVAGVLNGGHLATLLMDLLTEQEEKIDIRTREYRFDIGMLAERLEYAAGWAQTDTNTAGLPIGYFGASTGGGAALVAAARQPDRIRAVVSRGGRPDLAGQYLSAVRAATLLIVGGDDGPVIGMNERALRQLRCTARMEIIPGATHLFEEPGALEEVARLARNWFDRFLPEVSADAR